MLISYFKTCSSSIKVKYNSIIPLQYLWLLFVVNVCTVYICGGVVVAFNNIYSKLLGVLGEEYVCNLCQ